jgi:endonuclease/exonuclease/phosphatase (EEP) superfamily protein YafD
MIKKLLHLLTATAIALQIVALCGQLHWVCELFTHYPVYYLTGSVFFLIILVIASHWKSTIWISAIIAINLALIMPYLTANNPGEEGNFKILANNIYYLNYEFEEIHELIAQEDPDIFIIHEASSYWEFEGEQWLEKYPYQYLTEETGVSGIFMASKHEGTFEEIQLGSGNGLAFNPENSNLQVLGVHPLAPITTKYAASRNEQLENIALHTQNTSKDLVIIGDFNCTPWSPYFKKLLEEGSLADARLPFGLHTTWHANWPWLQIPIDHALTTKNLEVTNFQALDAINSDHSPIVVELNL